MCVFSQVIAEELSGNDDYVELSFSARKLDDKVSVVHPNERHKNAEKCDLMFPFAAISGALMLLNISGISDQCS